MVAKVPRSDEVISMARHAGSAIHFRGTPATTTLRTTTSTRSPVTVTNMPFSPALLPWAGAVPSTTPPAAGMSRITAHGTVAVSATGVRVINGAVTFESRSC